MKDRICKKCHRPTSKVRGGLCKGCEKDVQAFKAWEQKQETRRMFRFVGRGF